MSGLIITKILNFILLAIVFTYVYNLEKDKCNCSKNWRRDFIKYYTSTMGIFIVINLILLMTNAQLTGISSHTRRFSNIIY